MAARVDRFWQSNHRLTERDRFFAVSGCVAGRTSQRQRMPFIVNPLERCQMQRVMECHLAHAAELQQAESAIHLGVAIRAAINAIVHNATQFPNSNSTLAVFRILGDHESLDRNGGLRIFVEAIGQARRATPVWVLFAKKLNE